MEGHEWQAHWWGESAEVLRHVGRALQVINEVVYMAEGEERDAGRGERGQTARHGFIGAFTALVQAGDEATAGFLLDGFEALIVQAHPEFPLIETYEKELQNAGEGVFTGPTGAAGVFGDGEGTTRSVGKLERARGGVGSATAA